MGMCIISNRKVLKSAIMSELNILCKTFFRVAWAQCGMCARVEYRAFTMEM